MPFVRLFAIGAFALLSLPSILSAAPRMRLVSTTVGPVSITAGAGGPNQEIEVYNAGDGALNMSVSSSAAWLTVGVLGSRPCSNRPGECIPVRLQFNTQPLTAGRYTATVTVRDPNAIDAPQNVLVIAQIGGGVPDSLNFFAAPNGSGDEYAFSTNSVLSANVQTSAGGDWLTLTREGGSFQFVIPYKIRARHLANMAEGTYLGNIQTAGSNIPAENKSVGVNLRITSQPIAALSQNTVRFRLPQGSAKQLARIAVGNRGMGTLAVNAPSVATSSGGNWLTAVRPEGFNLVDITADPSGLSPGIYRGTVTVASNAANGSINVPAELEIIAAGPPVAFAGQVLNNANFARDEPVAQGGIAALFGEQLHVGDPVANTSATQLPAALGETRVFVNDQPAPLYYVSYNQINFQVPFNVPPGEMLVRVERAGQRGNTVAVGVRGRYPRFMQLSPPYNDDRGNPYALATFPNTVNFPLPERFGLPGSRPAREGETLVFYVLGLGQAASPVQAGAAVPADPLPVVPGNWKVTFGAGPLGGGITVDPIYVGFTPGFVGLYQVNVTVPQGVVKGDSVFVQLQSDTVGSNSVIIATQ